MTNTNLKDSIKNFVKVNRAVIAKQIKHLQETYYIYPTVAILCNFNNSSSVAYMNSIIKACENTDLEYSIIHIEDRSELDVIEIIKRLNNDNNLHGIIVTLPLSKQFNTRRVLNTIDPLKDIDCVTDVNIGKLFTGKPRYYPCTPMAIVNWLVDSNVRLSGMNIVVVGRSDIVGKPLATILTQKDATVTLCHSKTQGLQGICKDADIVITAIGQPKMLTTDYFTLNTLIIDAGINVLEDGSICGDVDYDNVKNIEGVTLTPVPNGIGRITTSMVVENCVLAAQKQIDKRLLQIALGDI